MTSFRHPPALVTLVAAAALAAGPTARAAPIAATYQVSLGGFADIVGSNPAPFSSLTARIAVRFDPAAGAFAASLDVLSLGIAPARFEASVAGAFLPPRPLLMLGGGARGAHNIAPGENDFVISLNVADPWSPSRFTCAAGFACGNRFDPAAVLASGYTVAEKGDAFWLATTGSVAVVSSVPGPAALPLPGLGLAAARGRAGQ